MRDWHPEHAVEIVAGTAPGGGLDRTARALASAIEAAQVLDVPLTVRNVPGDGARKAWAYMDERRGDPHFLSVSHPNLTTDRLVGLASFDLSSYTQIAMLYTEYIAFVARTDSSLQRAGDLLQRMSTDASSLSVALSTAVGNPNHIALARLVRHAGGNPQAPLVRVFDSALDAVSDVVSGHSDVAAVTAASTAQALASRRVRILAVSAPERLTGAYAAVPTWREQSVDCIVGAWRGVAAAAHIGESHVAFWQEILKAATSTEEWQSELARNAWTASYMTGAALLQSLEHEREEMAATLNELGLLRLDAAHTRPPQDCS